MGLLSNTCKQIFETIYGASSHHNDIDMCRNLLICHNDVPNNQGVNYVLTLLLNSEVKPNVMKKIINSVILYQDKAINYYIGRFLFTQK